MFLATFTLVIVWVCQGLVPKILFSDSGELTILAGAGIAANQARAVLTGVGVVQEIWYGKPCTMPFLYIGTQHNIMFPQRGQNVPFTIKNCAYPDSFGRETVTWAGCSGRCLATGERFR